jgi:hypothetical protein
MLTFRQEEQEGGQDEQVAGYSVYGAAGCDSGDGASQSTNTKRQRFAGRGHQPDHRTMSLRICHIRGGWGVWLFCPKCGAPVFWKSNKGDQIAIFAGTLDDLRMYKPKK